MKYAVNLLVLFTFIWSSLGNAIPPVDLEGRELRAPLIQSELGSNPATPAAGKRKLFPKSDGYYQMDSTGNVTKVGSGSGGTNYIAYPDAEGGTTGWSTYNDSVSFASGSGVVDTVGDGINLTGTTGQVFRLRQRVYYVNTTTPIGGLTSGTDYYIVAITPGSPNYIQLGACSTCAAIDLTSQGSGTNTFSPYEPYDGTGGTSSLGLVQGNTGTGWNPALNGASSFVMSKPSSTMVLGQGWSTSFTIDGADQGRRLTLTLNDAFAAGTFTEGDLKFYIVDVTNGTLCDSARGSTIGKHLISTGAPWTYTFDAHSNSTSYRLVEAINVTHGTSWSWKTDNYLLANQSVTTGPPMSQRTQGTCTSAWTTNATTQCWWHREGQYAYVEWLISFTGAPGPATTLAFDMPQGLVMDDSAMMKGAYHVEGRASANGTSGNSYTFKPIGFVGSNTVSIYYQGSTSTAQDIAVQPAAPVAWASGQSLAVYAKVPIVGWNTGMVLSSDSSQLGATVASYTATASQTLTFNASTTLKWGTTDVQKFVSMDPTTGLGTFLTDGTYTIDLKLMSGTATSTGYTVQPTIITTRGNRTIESSGVSPSFGSSLSSVGGITKDFKAGDTFQVQVYQYNSASGATAVNVNSTLTVTKVGNGTQTVGYQYTAPTTCVLSAGGASSCSAAAGGVLTIPTGASYIEVEATAGGGAGGGAGTSGAGQGGDGGATIMGSFLNLNGGPGGGGSSCNGCDRGYANGYLYAPADGIVVNGESGHGANANMPGSGVYVYGGMGGSSPFGGAGSMGHAATGFGSGGGGGNLSAASQTNFVGGSGSAGAYAKFKMNVTSGQTISYSVGGAGSPGSAGASGLAGGTGGAGIIIVKIYYANAGDSSVPQNLATSTAASTGIRIEAFQTYVSSGGGCQIFLNKGTATPISRPGAGQCLVALPAFTDGGKQPTCTFGLYTNGVYNSVNNGMNYTGGRWTMNVYTLNTSNGTAAEPATTDVICVGF